MTAINITKDGGLVKTIVKPGKPEDGHPNTGDTVYVNYVGKLKDTGEEFDSNRGEPFKFTLGANQVIKGWDLGVATMLKGEVADLECRADYAYGKEGSPPKIPGDATLIFNVELLNWEGEDISPDRDGSILKSTIVKGEKYNCPVENSPVTVHAVGMHNGRVFYDRDVKFLLGEGSEQQLPDGVDRALRRVDKGEKCQVVLKNRFTYGTNPPPEFGLPPNAELTFTLFLKDFEKVKASWELLDNEKLEEAQKLKDRGTMFLGQGKLQLALQKYQSVVSLLEHVANIDEELKKRFDAMLVAAFLNSALVYLKQNQTSKCIKNCEKALEKDPNNVKALYRKAQALEQRKDYNDAVDEYKRVIEVDPSNKAAVQQIAICKQKIAEARDKERKRFAGLFDRLRADEPEVASSSTVPDAAAEPAEA